MAYDELENEILALVETEPRQTRRKSTRKRRASELDTGNKSDDSDFSNDSSDLSSLDEDHLNSLTELEREKIFTDRHERLQVQRERKALREKLKGVESVRPEKKPKLERKRKQEKKDATEPYKIDIAEVHKLQITRNKIERLFLGRRFDHVIKGAIIRVSIGAGAKQVYRVAEVMETRKVTPYNFGSASMDRSFILTYGSSKITTTCEFFSNSPITPDELADWQKKCAQDNIVYTRDKVYNKIRELEDAQSHTLNENDVALIIKENQRKSQIPRNRAAYKAELIRLHDVAVSSGDQEAADKLYEELAVLFEDNKKKSFDANTPRSRKQSELPEDPVTLPYVEASKHSVPEQSDEPVPDEPVVVASYEQMIATAGSMLNVEL